MKSLFHPIVKEENLSESFKSIINFDGYEPGRLMMDEVFSKYKDVDGNFVEQFQTTGFDQRTFELYLFSYFDNIGFNICKDYNRPDFIINKSNQKIAIEATTASPSNKISSKEFSKLSEDEKKDYLINEIPIRLGSSLYSKLKKQYWKLKQCHGIPFVIAIESFYNNESLQFSFSSLAKYLYGLDQNPIYDLEGNLHVESNVISNHQLPAKNIPSGFFKQADVENISAIIFTNSGTFPKFNRMGYLKGYCSNSIIMIREGTCYNYAPNASTPNQFIYNIDDVANSPLEYWGQGIEIFYNPNAKIPLERGLFLDAAEHYLINNTLYSDIHKPFHPYSSKTAIIFNKIDIRYDEKKYKRITLFEFDNLLQKPERKIAQVKEICWIRSLDFSLLMCIIIDTVDYDYSFAIYKNINKAYQFEYADTSYKNIDDVSAEMLRIAENVK